MCNFFKPLTPFCYSLYILSRSIFLDKIFKTVVIEVNNHKTNNRGDRIAQCEISREEIEIHEAPKTPPEHYNRNTREDQTKVGTPLFLYSFLYLIHTTIVLLLTCKLKQAFLVCFLLACSVACPV